MSPKNLRPSGESKLILEIHLNFLMYLKKVGEEDHRAPITEEVEEFGEIRTAGVPDSKISETSYFQSQMHFDDSMESIADSEDGESQKMLTSPLYAQKALGNPVALFSSEQGNLIKSSVFRNADPSNYRGSLLESNKDHLLSQARSDLTKQELHVESLNKCIGEVQRQTDKQRLALQDAQYGFVESGREQIRLQEFLKEKFSDILKYETCTKLEKSRERKNNVWMRSQCKS